MTNAAAQLLLAVAAGFAAMAVVGPRLAGRSTDAGRGTSLPVAGLAAVAGVLAVLAPAAATGVEPLDGALRAALAAGVVLVGARAPFSWLAAAAVLVAAGGFDGRWAWIGGAAAGAAVAVVLARLDGPLPRAMLAVGISQAALRLAWPRPALATAGMAAAALALPVLGGLPRLAPAVKRRAVRLAVLAGGLAVAATVLAGVAAARSRTDLEAGVSLARSALSSATAGRASEAADDFARARTAFVAASGRLDAWWARPAQVVPLVSRQRRALVTMAVAGAEVAGTGERLARSSDPARFRLGSGGVPVDGIRALQTPSADAFAVLDQAGRQLRRVQSPWLAAPVADRLDALLGKVDRARDQARTAMVASRLAPGLLGADGPRRYFLAVQTPAELRGSGGFIGNFGQVTADHGALRLDRVGRTATLNTSGNPASRRLRAPDDYLRRYSRFDPEHLWQNVTLSPDFPTVAQVIEDLYPQSGGEPVDGVLAVDPYGLAAMLRVVGPVSVRSWPEPITADNAAHVLLFDQYVRLQGDARVDFLGEVTAAVWQQLVGSSAGVVDVARALAPALAGKHLLLASARPEEESALRTLGVAGAVPPVDGDFVGVVTQNAGANKIDWFLRRAVDSRVRLDPATGRVESTVEVRLTNLAPARGLPPYIIGNGTNPPLPDGTNKLYLSIYTPWLLTGATLDGAPALLESELELDRHVYSTYVVIPPGGTATVELHLTGQVRAGSRPFGVTVFHQPAVEADAVQTVVDVPNGWSVCDAAGHCGSSASEAGPLERDRRMAYRVRRASG